MKIVREGSGATSNYQRMRENHTLFALEFCAALYAKISVGVRDSFNFLLLQKVMRVF